MLPLVSNVLPQPPVAQNNAQGLAQLALQTGPAGVGGRQLPTVAVSASGAVAAFNTQLPQRRGDVNFRPSYPPQPERPEILPDPEFWKVPTRQAGEPVLPPPLPRAPVQVNLPQTTQFAAQVIAQQPPRAEREEPLPPQRRVQNLPGKKPGLGEARGTDAYAVATRRIQSLVFPSTVESVS